MNKKISLGAAIAYMAIVAAVAFSLTMIYSMNLFNVKMTGITEREKMYSSRFDARLPVCFRICHVHGNQFHKIFFHGT